MTEVTSKVLGNQPDVLIESGCRARINAGTDDEMTITGYRLVRSTRLVCRSCVCCALLETRD
jgi:hypothetical protein